ncbi:MULTISPECIES: divalent-cation tolerance protein CutA [Thermomonospora]|uniref:CutA1 divalent ion tolerance protein n=1 Tax=Thermomonospora curvata (strain ATCC 19995 / DSM 43183 / JCM 3096 / KCTC 9072 / NBRC 15933 / NCIMB 10081 / Henssen B9) TaxID=471852 RepID=D1A939_THECD|nr:MULTISPECIES: divalent-cation tolerance protein CutA [Thermomonospora]ACY98677.1 CutA1 divalent ion tolerance protein [Thermomonospora curvata DSM 43183]PKK13802.1 MAG: divalent-cation tolerance protein CutA [Thermomonospora sp. CIF 1]
MPQAYLQVTTTTDSRQEAAALAKSAVRERLAACAQLVGPISSTYWWEGEMETAEEWMVVFKTTADNFEELATLITELHSYDTPEIIATPVVAGSSDYLRWVSEQTKPVETADESAAPRREQAAQPSASG